MKTRRTGLTIVVAGVLGLSTLAVAGEANWGRGFGQGGPGRPGRGNRGGAPMRMGAGQAGRPMGGAGGQFGRTLRGLRQLDLTDEQATQIRELVQAARSQAETQREAVVQARKALSDATADGAAEEAVRAAAEAFAKAVGDQAVLHAKTLASVKAVLTEEQREELGKIQEAVGPLRGPGQGPRGRMGLQDRPGAGRPGPGPGFQGDAGPQGRMNGRMGRGAGRGPQMGPGNGRGPGAWLDGNAGPQGRWNQRPGRGAGRGLGMQPGNRLGRGPAPVDEMFEDADVNEDGVLSKEEVERHRDAMGFEPQLGRR